MVTMTLYVRQQKGHRCIERSFGLSNDFMGFPESSLVKNPPAMRETWVRSLGWLFNKYLLNLLINVLN